MRLSYSTYHKLSKLSRVFFLNVYFAKLQLVRIYPKLLPVESSLCVKLTAFSLSRNATLCMICVSFSLRKSRDLLAASLFLARRFQYLSSLLSSGTASLRLRFTALLPSLLLDAAEEEEGAAAAAAAAAMAATAAADESLPRRAVTLGSGGEGCCGVLGGVKEPAEAETRRLRPPSELPLG